MLLSRFLPFRNVYVPFHGTVLAPVALSWAEDCQCASGIVAGIGTFYATTDGRSLVSLGLADLGIILGSIGLAVFLAKFLGLMGVAMESRILAKIVPFPGPLLLARCGSTTFSFLQRCWLRQASHCSCWSRRTGYPRAWAIPGWPLAMLLGSLCRRRQARLPPSAQPGG